MAMTVEMRQEARFVLRRSEINNEDAAFGLQDSSNFAETLLTNLSRKVMEHQRAQHHIDRCVAKRQCLRDGCFEKHVDSRLRGLRACPRDHLW